MDSEPLNGVVDEPLTRVVGDSSKSINSTELEKQTTTKAINGWQAGFSLFKCVVGAGSFILPDAFKKAGLTAGVIGLLFIGILSLYTIKLLAESERMFVGKEIDKGTPSMSSAGEGAYQAIGEAPIDNTTLTLQEVTYTSMGEHTFHRSVGWLIYFGTLATILGVCAVYVVFIAQEMNHVFDDKISILTIQLIVTIPFVLMAWLRSFRYLAFTSILGDVSVIGGFLVVIIDGFLESTDKQNVRDLPQFNPSTFSLFFGETVFLFAIHVAILPIAQAMKKPSRFQMTANVTFTLIIVMNGLFGAIGYALYGDATKGLILENVNNLYAQKAIQTLISVDLFFTVPIVLAAPREIIEHSLLGKPQDRGKHRILKENVVRIFIVVLFVIIAIAVPNVNDLATLVGGLISPIMGFVIPPLLYLKLRKMRGHPVSMVSLIGHAAIAIFGIVAMVFTTVQHIQEMVEDGIN